MLLIPFLLPRILDDMPTADVRLNAVSIALFNGKYNNGGVLDFIWKRGLDSRPKHCALWRNTG